MRICICPILTTRSLTCIFFQAICSTFRWWSGHTFWRCDSFLLDSRSPIEHSHNIGYKKHYEVEVSSRKLINRYYMTLKDAIHVFAGAFLCFSSHRFVFLIWCPHWSVRCFGIEERWGLTFGCHLTSSARYEGYRDRPMLKNQHHMASPAYSTANARHIFGHFFQLFWSVDIMTTFSTSMHILNFAVVRYLSIRHFTVYQRITERRAKVVIFLFVVIYQVS